MLNTQNGFQPPCVQLVVSDLPTHNTKKEEKRGVSLSQEKVLSYIKRDCFQLSEEEFGAFVFLLSNLSASPTWLSSRLLASWDRPHLQKSHPQTSLCLHTVASGFEDEVLEKAQRTAFLSVLGARVTCGDRGKDSCCQGL